MRRAVAAGAGGIAVAGVLLLGGVAVHARLHARALKHAGPITRLVTSADGRLLLSIARKRELALSTIDPDREGVTPISGPTRVDFDVELAVVTSSGGVALLGGYGTLAFWHPTPAPIRKYDVGVLSAVAIAPDARTAVVAEEPTLSILRSTLTLWSIADERPLPTTVALSGSVMSLAYSSDGHALLVGTTASLELRDATSLSLVRRFPPSVGYDFAAIREREKLVVFSSRGILGVRPLDGGPPIWTSSDELVETGIPDGDLVCSWSKSQGQVRAFAVSSGRMITLGDLGANPARTALTVSGSSGSYVAIEGLADGRVIVRRL